MLADGCESAVRSSSDHSREKIEEIVRQIVRERLEAEQLNECPLTMQDLERALRAFCAVLNGLYHPRIEYPDSAELVAPAAAVER
jgi:membrane-associated HD superfamily phosphohydrolase